MYTPSGEGDGRGAGLPSGPSNREGGEGKKKRKNAKRGGRGVETKKNRDHEKEEGAWLYLRENVEGMWLSWLIWSKKVC